MSNHIISGRSNNSTIGNRQFRLEVEGLHQNEPTNRSTYAIRPNTSLFITVPFNRLNRELQRVNRLGGKIISIQPLNLEADSTQTQGVQQ